ncbi:hypothetical protein RHMOL_Rhmol12G0107200 [Rhododendron molle]|uniref:Uncharacterized protein n=1 Tax=Rhododendron molle TaxID=49168 RepID=A0ACC0LGI1_RHOML|nr:hypothetical protein RHMOL_Rhmol12G0107200 [Rhododendron molle]
MVVSDLLLADFPPLASPSPCLFPKSLAGPLKGGLASRVICALVVTEERNIAFELLDADLQKEHAHLRIEVSDGFTE